MNDIQIDIAGLDGLLALFERYPEITREVLEETTLEASLLAEREIKERTPTGVGGAAGLKGSIASQEPAWLGDELVGAVSTPLEYALPVELGTKPHFPPVEALEDWVRAKLDVDEERVSSVAFLIARKISVRGTDGAHMFERGFDAARDRIDAMFARVPATLLERAQ